MAAIFIETSILIHDFFYRQPEFFPADKISSEAAQQEMEAFREEIHVDMLRLSMEDKLRVGTSAAIIQRFAAILDEYKIPVETAREEVSYLLSNYKIDAVKQADLCAALEAPEYSSLPPALAMLKQYMQQHKYTHIYTCQLWPAAALLPFVKLTPGMVAHFISSNINNAANADS